MAVYRCEVKTMGRASGRSAVAAAAYRAADRLRDEQADKAHDYRRRGPGVAYAEILTPSGAPEWANKRGKLWNEAERAEKRKNSVTAREVLVSLPHELSDQQRAELVRGFASRLVERYGVAVDLSIHRPDRKGDQRNHHAHLMMTTRRLSREGFTEKTRELDDMKKRGPEEIEAIRALWEKEQNQALQRAGQVERVSRLSNKAQGIEREPQPKLGEAATALMRRGEPSRLADRWKQVAARNTEREKKHSAMRENMARQAEQRMREREERLAKDKLPGGVIYNAVRAALREESENNELAKQQAEALQKQSRHHSETPEKEKAAIRQDFDAAARQQRANQSGPAHIAQALMRDTSEAQQGKQEAERLKKEESQKLAEERQRAAEAGKIREWKRQRQTELRKRREKAEQQNQNDMGRVMTPPTFPDE